LAKANAKTFTEASVVGRYGRQAHSSGIAQNLFNNAIWQDFPSPHLEIREQSHIIALY
jgi:hypothetical protein